MSEVSGTSNSKPQATLQRLKQARSKSAWLGWVSLLLAFIWWVASLSAALSYFGMDVLQQAPTPMVLAGAAMVIMPGLMLAMAGLFAREQARSHAVNEIVFEAAALLLTPAEALSQETTTFAEDMVKASGSIDRSMGHALSAMKAMSVEIGDERARLESVTYASADNARDLAERLGNERTGLEVLAKDLREQTTLLNQAIPAQAEMMVSSAQSAAQEVAQAEEALQARLEALDATGKSLAQRISTLDTLAAEANRRNEDLVFAINRMEEKLEQSRKTVETASRAGELAAAAASTTGDRLLESVNAALDGAKQASDEIHRQAVSASEQSALALQQLKQASQETASAVRSVGMASRAEAELQEPRPAAPNISRTLRERSAKISERMSPAQNGSAARAHSATSTLTAASKATPSSPARSTSPSVTVEEDLFEANADRMAQALMAQQGPRGENPDYGSDYGKPNAAEHVTAEIFETDTRASAPRSSGPNRSEVRPPSNAENGNSLSEIIADMEREERSDLSREDVAQELIKQLEDSGMRLNDIFRPKDKKKIALAARKGEVNRRAAIDKQSGRQVERVRQRLRGNLNLTSLARNFLEMEMDDALNALENTRGSSKNASARLAAFLLLDAALD